jgi:hypothetical protein
LDAGAHAWRAERIARLTFDYLLELMNREPLDAGAGLSLGCIEAPAVHVRLDAMEDEAVARACAGAVFGSLLGRM